VYQVGIAYYEITSVTLLPGCLNSLKEKIQNSMIGVNKCFEPVPVEYTQKLGRLSRNGSTLLFQLMPAWGVHRQFCLYLTILKDIVVSYSYDDS
jgi:hypothetical protein